MENASHRGTRCSLQYALATRHCNTQPLCRAKQLWELVHDDDAIARERETAAKNRKKYTGYDRTTVAFAGRSGLGSTSSSRPESPTPEAFTTTPKPAATSTNGADQAADGGTGDVDAVAATEARISKLAITDDGDTVASGASPAARVRPKPKLSQISVRFGRFSAPRRTPERQSAQRQRPAANDDKGAALHESRL